MSDKRLRLDIVFCYPDKRKRDCDNSLKSVVDSLVKNGLCLDDEQFDELHIKRGSVVKGGLIKIKVFELDVAIN
ncbi:crossover junction endodeoxyribonuclease [Acinetobacter phage Abp95]|nr:crossover junction endodeoxyribonuclease [Acinetobacter phage Abp95]